MSFENGVSVDRLAGHLQEFGDEQPRVKGVVH